MTRRLVGQPLPEFERPTAAGAAYRSSDAAGSWLLLVFHRHLM